MRGARRQVHPRRRRQGIIPAYAGSTSHNLNAKASERDHPRVCGEHFYMDICAQLDGGSSPRMRGARARLRVCLGGMGIIPAYAGSTRPSRLSPSRWRDHPRVCGEHTPPRLRVVGWTGSSPRMRGARKAKSSNKKAGGIIPAYAGSTHELFSEAVPVWDHPRVCGEHHISMKSWQS